LNSRDPYGQFLIPACTLAGGSDSPPPLHFYRGTRRGKYHPRRPRIFCGENEWYYPPSLKRLGID